MKLYIFDFDDTLAMTDSHVRVIRVNGNVDRLGSREFAKYRAEPGDNLDFSEFTEASGTLIEDTVQEMESAIQNYGISNVYIVTARSQSEPVGEFLESMGVTVPEIVATSGSEGKATWLTKKLISGKYDTVMVYEDCRKNITMLKDVVEAYNEELEKEIVYKGICILPGGSQELADSVIRKYIKLMIENKTQDKRMHAFSNQITRTVMDIFHGKAPGFVERISSDELLVDTDLENPDIYEFSAGELPIAIDPSTIDADAYDEDMSGIIFVTVEIDKFSKRTDVGFDFNVSASDKPTTGMSNFGIHLVIETIPDLPAQSFGLVRNEIANSIRHELEHVSQGRSVDQVAGAYNRGEKYWTFAAGPEDVDSSTAKYLLKPEEIPAHVRGYLQNSKSLLELENNFKIFLDGYVDNATISKDESALILETWLTWVEENINRKRFQKN